MRTIEECGCAAHPRSWTPGDIADDSPRDVTVTVTVILCNVSSVPAAGCGFLSSGGRCVAYTQCAPFLHLLDTLLKPVDPRIGGE